MSCEDIYQAFQSLGVYLNTDWLTAIEVVQDGPLTNDIVYQALAASDLRQSCIVPPDHVLRGIIRSGFSRLPEGSFLFQLTRVEDISIPDSQRPRTSASTKRVLKFSLHLGDITLTAIENEAISAISDMPDAGLKVIVSGSPDLVDGVVFLEPQNIQIIGGEVPELSTAQRNEIQTRIRSRDPLDCSFHIPLGEIQNRQ